MLIDFVSLACASDPRTEAATIVTTAPITEGKPLPSVIASLERLDTTA